jgi:hypothetical protein
MRLIGLCKGIATFVYFGVLLQITTDVITIDVLKLFAKVVFCEAFLSSRRKYRGTGMFMTVSKPLAHLNFLSGVNCYDISSSAIHGRLSQLLSFFLTDFSQRGWTRFRVSSISHLLTRGSCIS